MIKITGVSVIDLDLKLGDLFFKPSLVLPLTPDFSIVDKERIMTCE